MDHFVDRENPDAAAGGGAARAPAAWSLLRSPAAVLLAAMVACAVLLNIPMTLPIGPMYWDLFVYFDAANRIFDGQAPVTDFFVPVGPLGYYLFAGALNLFPEAQPLLLAHWSMLAVTGPLMLLVLWRVQAGSRAVAFALLLPFLVFALLPFNTREYYPFPGSDGFGIYNRQVCHLLYVLTAALVFLRGPRLLAATVAAAMSALFLTKITGFAAGLVLCAFAFAAGRIPWRQALASALAFVVFLGLLELANGLVSAYLGDILALVAMNSESLAPRFLQAASQTFGVVAPAGVLVLVLLAMDRRELAAKMRGLRAAPSAASLSAVIDHPALWLAAALFAGILFETQNTGSQAMIHVWPVLLLVLVEAKPAALPRARLAAVLLLVGAAALPPFVNTVERAARTYVGMVKHVPLDGENLGTLGRINARPEMMARAREMMRFYPAHRETYAALAEIDQLPDFIFHSQPDFQLTHLMAVDRAVASLAALEAERGVRFETMMTLSFVNPFPYLMQRSAPAHIAIGADPTRAVPQPGPRELDAVSGTDVVLLPTCPVTSANLKLLAFYETALARHRRMALDACYDAFVHPRVAERLD